MVCPACGMEMVEGARFCSGCGRATMMSAAYAPVRGTLVRPREGRMIAGVCAGFAQRYGWDTVVVRLVLTVVVVFGCGTPLLAYLIAWIVMPNEPYVFPQTIGGPAR